MTGTRQDAPKPRRRLAREDRRRIVLETATRLFTAHGVHAVGMDRLIAETGLGKMSVYRLYPTKDDLIGAYLTRLAGEILGLIDDAIDTAEDAHAALRAIVDGVEADIRRPTFRGCPFGNAASEYDDPTHPAREIARDYRLQLLDRLDSAARPLDQPGGSELARQLAVLIDGIYLNAANLGPNGPATDGLTLARRLIANSESP